MSALDLGKTVVSELLARAVARQAVDEGLAEPRSDEAIVAAIDAELWEPVYRRYRRKR